MPKANGYSCLKVWVDTFTGWIEAFPCCSEQAKEVMKILNHEIIPRFGLPRSLQSDNGSAFKAAVTEGVSKALGIEYHLHCSWRPQSLGKVEKANDIIERHLHPRGMGWEGRREGGSGWGTHVNPWLIHVNVWQKPLQYCKVISHQLIKINEKKKT